MSTEKPDLEKALREKLRFPTPKCLCSLEDIFDLSLVVLNEAAKAVNRELKQSQEEDFLKTYNETDSLNKLRLDILVYVINLKQKEKKDKEEAAKKKQRRQQLLEALEEIDQESLKNKTKEDILKELEELNG